MMSFESYPVFRKIVKLATGNIYSKYGTYVKMGLSRLLEMAVDMGFLWSVEMHYHGHMVCYTCVLTDTGNHGYKDYEATADTSEDAVIFAIEKYMKENNLWKEDD